MKCKSFTTFAGWFAVLAGVFCFLYSVSFVILMNDLLDGLFLLLSGFCAVLVVVVWRWVPETKGKSLEEIERSWLRA